MRAVWHTATWLLAWAIAASGAPLHWRQEPGSVALLRNEKIIWQFNFGADASKPFFHPLALPDGSTLTADRPSDHRWHHGLWFSWKFINGVNYWEEDPTTGKSAGLTEWSQPQIKTRPDFSARIALDVTYRPAQGKPILTEKRVIEISPPGADGAYSLDWTLTFTAVDQDVLLDRTPLLGEPDGKSWGGYAGLSVRFINELSDLRLDTGEGQVVLTNGIYRGRANGLDYSARFADREAGIAMFGISYGMQPHPWYAISDGKMNYLNAAVIQYQPLALKAGQTLTLRYRVIVHPGRWTPEQMRRAFMRFASSKH